MNDDALARDVIRDWPRRSVVGQALVSRLGARAWAAPRFAKGRKLFPKFGLPDPWDPDAPSVDIGLGDVALPERRVVAPHAAPPPAPGSPAKPGLPNVPRAAQRSESTQPAKGKPAPQIGEVRKFDPSELKPKAKTTAGRPQAPAKKPENPRIFGSAPVKHAVAKLPVRPGFGPAAEPGAPPEPAPPAPAASPATVHAPRPGQIAQAAGAAPAAPRPASTSTSTSTSTVASATPASRAAIPSRPSAPTTTVAAPLRPAPPAPLTPSPAPSSPAASPAASPPRPAAPVNRKPPGPGGGLDDLFGMGAGDNTRIKLPKPAEGDAPKPRRPMVSSPEELAKLGLDRRPPVAKPPAGTPSPSSTPSAPAKDDLPDE